MKKHCWSGKQWYCPSCGQLLIEFKNEKFKEEKSKIDFSSDEEYYKYYDEFIKNSKVLLECFNKKCQYSGFPAFNLFHPIYGIDSFADDSWAIGYIK
jgi:hypothetical protein